MEQLDLGSSAYVALGSFSLKHNIPDFKTMLTPNKRTTRHTDNSIHLETLLSFPHMSSHVNEKTGNKMQIVTSIASIFGHSLTLLILDM